MCQPERGFVTGVGIDQLLAGTPEWVHEWRFRSVADIVPHCRARERGAPASTAGAPLTQSNAYKAPDRGLAVHRVDAHHRVGPRVDVVDLPPVGAVVAAIAIAILVAIAAVQNLQVARNTLAHPQAAAAQ